MKSFRLVKDINYNVINYILNFILISIIDVTVFSLVLYYTCVTGLDRSYQYSGGGCSEEVPQVLIWVRGYSCSGPGSKTSSQNQTKPLLHRCQEGKRAYY